MVLHCHAAVVTISTPNLAKLSQFYSDLLGMGPHIYIEGVYAEFQLPGLQLGIFEPRGGDRQEFSSPGGAMSLCLQVCYLEKAIENLVELGYPPPGEIITASHGREIYAYDPCGNRIILYESQTNPKLDS
ncbi:VOC family protein [Arthrospira platensis]|mgnify:CR=1 FL=1|uniref:VOC domain-containing protein n=1 Tax=Limnospira platensis NIES-46 TaxID=1236695 RepID=A0A5M3T3Z6_LIMPL|nr:VOC family protein [Arthrospira platensis]AMW27590.1 glyoxalase [Arthrospira platensis YZ]MBD2709348.1 glyoxalase/bleomycin resistance/dioxygenase family protein [Arthrospira platensis FACHB-835]MDF2209970.1 glyoxalase/bleomycin resistance/dioxygenase family protein [Arthrospira platensis NCB002]MDT9294707.1 glyoxalase/bleomycin resistance/dioxygenase family protein [Arthrospira platensis PCC 7345]QQW30340.1 glyoxalase/bleomycin resistance/dioxygenase family protein [Arthrospira sp. PCC 910